MPEKPANRERLIADLAARQHGVVTTAQLAGAGLDHEAIRYRVVAGRLHRLHRGVYAVGHPAIPAEGTWLAAVLACGGGAFLSHRSAAELWGIAPRAAGPIHVTIPTNAGREKRRGLIVHRSRTLEGLTTQRDGIPVTTPRRTLADLRRGVSEALHQRATRRALDLGLISRGPELPDEALTRSELERSLLRLCARHRLPQPVVNARIGPYEVDFLWPEHHLIVETDGFAYHGSREAFERDRDRDADLQARGFRVLRVTHRRLRSSPRKVAESIRTLLGSAPSAP